MRNLRKMGRNQQMNPEQKKEGISKDEIKKSVAPGMEQKVTDVIRQYEGKSQEELTHDIMKAVQQGKEKGEIDNTTLDRYYSMLSPMMDAKQKDRLAAIMRQLKS